MIVMLSYVDINKQLISIGKYRYTALRSDTSQSVSVTLVVPCIAILG